MLQLGGEYPAELLRLCTSKSCPKGGGSKLCSRARRIRQLTGGTHFHTYTLSAESGASMRGAGLQAALPHGTTGISQVSQWKLCPCWTVTTLNPSGTRRTPLLNGLISKSSASPVLPDLGHRTCSIQS